MLINEILGQYIPDSLNLDLLNLSQTNLSRASLSIEKRDGEKLSGGNANAVRTSDPSLILAPVILLVMSGAVIFYKLKLSCKTNNIKNLDEFNCKNCHFFSKNSYLKCAVNPSIVLTKEAIKCCDYQPLENRNKISLPIFQSKSKVN